MNHLVIIGNLTKDPETRVTQDGKKVCNFTVAVNRRQKDRNGNDIADFFRVSAWNGLAETCQKYLAKGRKVGVSGRVSAHAYMTNDGNPAANLEILANDVEFLSSKNEGSNNGGGFTPVEEEDSPWG